MSATMTLNLSDNEASVLHRLAIEQELSQSQLMRQALRLYQHVHLKTKQGQTMAFVDKDGNVIRQEIIGMNPSTLAQQVANAQAEYDTWSEERKATVRLEGGDQAGSAKS